MAFTAIRYTEFYDVPRVFVFEHGGALFLFDCPFDERADEYPDHYSVYRIDGRALPADHQPDWPKLMGAGRQIGECQVSAVRFDVTRRSAVDDSVLARGITSVCS